MDKLNKYYGVIILVVVTIALIFGAYSIVNPQIQKHFSIKNQVAQKEDEVAKLQQSLTIVQQKLKKLKDSIEQSQKKIYSPVENYGSDTNETLFFTLYNDVIEMLHANSVKIKSIDYTYNPENDAFVKLGQDAYFVCDINMELVSNYVNLGKLIQDIYQYPYYIRINELEVKPYQKDKKFLISTLSLRLYAHVTPEVEESTDAAPISGAETALPQ